ncbi:hypothetical protein CY35_11G046100 [Sphagnum magellanicum]|nr:hypothetical protein CY35_11G046100 [Sphagnum magellanicum]
MCFYGIASLFLYFYLWKPWGLSILIKEWFLKPWEVEEFVWLDKVMANSSEIQSQDLDIEIHAKTIQLVETYNEHSIHSILHLLTDTIYFVTFGNPFFILLLTDLCIGFHSPHGWEIVIDTIFKYCIFRHLNRISPSIVVDYHMMNK